jgi:GGDEF domain-containing protein
MTTLTRIAVPAALIALAIGPAAHAQTISPSGGVSAVDIGQSGVSLEVNPQQGVKVGVDAGETGGITVGAGTQGAQANLKQGAVSVPGATRTTPQKAEAPSGVNTPVRSPSRPGGETGPAGPTAGVFSVAGADEAPSGNPAKAGDSSRSTVDRRVDPKPAAEQRTPGVAPVIDLIEKIPAAVWAALASLGLIALALWLMWVRGRRRLERNAWVDTDSPEMNVVAFETLLAQEWARSDRDRRPLGLLLLELEEPTSEGGRRPLTGRYRSDAQDAITTHAREADTVAQLSPSRFAVICPESSQGSIETLARRLEHSLEAARVHARVGTAGRLESDRGPADLVSRAAVGIDEQPTWATPVITPPAAKRESEPVAA